MASIAISMKLVHEVHNPENSQHELIKVMVEVSVSQQNYIIMVKEELGSFKSLFIQNDLASSKDILKAEICLLQNEN